MFVFVILDKFLLSIAHILLITSSTLIILTKNLTYYANYIDHVQETYYRYYTRYIYFCCYPDNTFYGCSIIIDILPTDTSFPEITPIV